MGLPFAVSALHVDGRIHKVYILSVQLLPQEFYCFAEPLKMDDLPFPEEFDHIVHIRIIGQPQNIVIGDPGFLLCQGVP